MKKKKIIKKIYGNSMLEHIASRGRYSRTGNWLVLLGITNHLSIIFVKNKSEVQKKISYFQQMFLLEMYRDKSYSDVGVFCFFF